MDPYTEEERERGRRMMSQIRALAQEHFPDAKATFDAIEEEVFEGEPPNSFGLHVAWGEVSTVWEREVKDRLTNELRARKPRFFS